MSYFADLDSKRFSFASQAMGLTESTFAVMSFKGYEAISKPYEFDILLVSNELELDLDEVLNSSAQFIIHRGDNDDVLYNGVLAEFEQLQEFSGHVVYRARLVPKLWWLTLTKHNQVFLNETVPEIVRLGLEDADFTQNDYDFLNVKEKYEPLEYVCQYDETHFNFISRWLEREGIYYYFSQGDDGERLMFSDISTTSDKLPQADELFYSPASGLESTHLSEVIRSLTCRQKQLPREIILKDFNYEKPSLDVTGRADVDPRGRGTSYIYGEHYPTPEEGDRLAAIRAEELLCQKQQFFGESTVPFMEPGFTFNLLNHYRGDYNQEYLIVEVTHEGSQTACLTPEIIGGIDNPEDKVAYMNTFKAIPAITQYRPEKTTDRPRISGTLNAKIDAEGDGEYAELDEQGRYKVKLPFDINDQHLDGKASARVRMMQPYAGTNKGMQFPLNKGTEVLLSFIDGHPDRPIIAGAVNNPETPGVVSANNQSESVISTGGANKLRMEDKSGSERLVLETPAANSWIRLGSHNDPISINPVTPEKFLFDTYIDPGATVAKVKADDTPDTPILEHPPSEYKKPSGTSFVPYTSAGVRLDEIGLWQFKFTHKGEGSDKSETTVIRQLPVRSDGTDIAGTLSNGIKIHSAGDLSLQGKGLFSEYVGTVPTAAELGGASTPLGGIRTKFGSDYSPTGMIPFSGATPSNTLNFVDHVLNNNAHVKLSKLDTVTTQEGNIYDFGGYWNYNLGNCYIENFMAQSASGTDTSGPTLDALPVGVNDAHLNQSRTGDMLSPAGPNWTTINWPSAPDGASNTLEGSYTGTAGNGKLWVEKKVGHSYDYQKGDAISVSDGSTLDVNYGGRRIEVNYRGRTHENPRSIASWTRSEDGITEEKKWTSDGTLVYDGLTKATDNVVEVDEKKFNRQGGKMFSHELSSTTGMGTASLSFNFANKTELNSSFGTKLSLDIDAAVKLEMKLAIAGAIDISQGAGYKIDIKGYLGGDVTLDGDKCIFGAPGIEAAKEKAAKINAGMAVVEQVGAKIEAASAHISQKTATITVTNSITSGLSLWL